VGTRPCTGLGYSSDITFSNCLRDGDNAFVRTVRPAASIAAAVRSSTSVVACQVLS
jgi:hypothetical protein